MKLTPLDIQQQQFRRSWRGLEPGEVQEFLDLVAAEYEELVRRNTRLQEEIRRKEERLEEYRQREHTLRETMITAQKITEDVKEGARKESEVIIAEAELRAEKIIHDAHSRLVELIEEIGELKRQRTRFLSELKGLVETHRKLLEEAVAEGEGPALEDKLRVLGVAGREKD